MNKYTFFARYLSLLLCVLFIAGCAVSHNRLGISQQEWDQYSPEKKEEIIQSYRQAQYQKELLSIRKGQGLLQVNIAGGTALLPPYSSPTTYQPLSFTLKQGDCDKSIPVESMVDSRSGKLKVCYANDTLYLDPSPYDPALSVGSMQFPYMAIWKRGFTYPEASGAGLLKLTNVDVTVKQLVSADD